MDDSTRARMTVFLTQEYCAASLAEVSGRFERAWHHLERAHIVAQTLLWPHCQSHWKMLGLAVRQRDWRSEWPDRASGSCAAGQSYGPTSHRQYRPKRCQRLCPPVNSFRSARSAGFLARLKIEQTQSCCKPIRT